jgi:hypothetical protein
LFKTLKVKLASDKINIWTPGQFIF